MQRPGAVDHHGGRIDHAACVCSELANFFVRVGLDRLNSEDFDKNIDCRFSVLAWCTARCYLNISQLPKP